MKNHIFTSRRFIFLGETPKGAQAEKPVSIEEEMKKETIEEKRVALVLQSTDVADMKNPSIKKYLEGVQEKLNRILARKGPAGVRSIPNVSDIAPGKMPQDIQGRVVRGTEMSRAYRKVYAELMNLAVDSLSARQENEFNSHKRAVCSNRATTEIEKFNNGKDEDTKKLQDADKEKVVEFINAAMGVNFDGKDKSLLTPAARVKKFADALQTVSIDAYAQLLLAEKDSTVYFTENGINTPNRTKMDEFAKMDKQYAAVLHGLMFRATDDAKIKDARNYKGLQPYNCYLLDTMVKNDVKAGMNPDDFRKLFMTFEEFNKDTYTVARYEKAYNNDLETAKMTPEQKVAMTAKFFKDAVQKAQDFIQKNGEQLSENQYLTVFNNLLANEWSKEAWNSRGLDAEILNKGAKDAGLTVLTYVSEGKPPQVPIPEGSPPSKTPDAQNLLARLTPQEKQQEEPRKKVIEAARGAIKGFIEDLDRISAKDRKGVLETRIKNALANLKLDSPVDDFVLEGTGIQINYKGPKNMIIYNCDKYVADIEKISTERVAAVIKKAVRTVKNMGLDSADSILNRLNLSLAQMANDIPDQDKKILSKTDPIKGASTKLLNGHKFVVTYDTATSRFSATEEQKNKTT